MSSRQGKYDSLTGEWSHLNTVLLAVAQFIAGYAFSSRFQLQEVMGKAI